MIPRPSLLRDRARGRGRLGTVAILLLVPLLLVALPAPGGALTVASSAPSSAGDLGTSPALAPSSVPISAPVALGPPQASGLWTDPQAAPASLAVNATLTLAPRDPSGLESYSSVLGAPPLTPSEVQADFGPSPSSVAALDRYLGANGLSAESPPNGWVWLLRGPASSFERAFATSIEEYQPTSAALTAVDPSGAPTLAFTRTPSVPAGLPVSALSAPTPVGNLRPLVEQVAPPSSSTGASPAHPSSSCPNGSLTPADVQTAYNITPVLATGTEGQGERIGIVDAFDSAENEWRISHDLAAFSGCYGLPDSGQGLSFAWPMPGPTDLNSSGSSGWGLEIGLDTQWAHASAPDANLTLVLSPNNAYGLYYAVDWLVATRDVDVISLSWGEPEVGIFNFGPCTYECNATTDGTLATLTPVIAAAADEGMDVFAASGDCGAAGGTLVDTPWYPASDPHAVGVGGSVLNVTSADQYKSETAWDGSSSFCLNGGGSGGGFSVFSRPGWQRGPGFPSYSNTTRGVPDVGLVAAVPLGMFYDQSPTYVEGTSDAAPQWAGMGALIAQDRGMGGLPGFLAPSLYQILRSSNYARDFHPIPTGWNGFGATYGWDPITGMGSPQFSSLLSAILDTSRQSAGLPSTILLNAEPQAGVGPLPVSFTAGALPAGAVASNYTFYYGDTGAPYGEGNASTVRTNSSSWLYPYAALDNLTYPGAGAYTAFASAADTNDNESLSIPVAINVGNAGPIEVQVTSTAGVADGPTFFDATASGGTAPYRFSYFFGDGTYEEGWASDGPTISHVYAQNGTYLVGVVANDSSAPMRGGYAVNCVVVGTSVVPCPTVPKTLVADMVPVHSQLVGGAGTMVRVSVTFDGVPVSGASVTLASREGTVTPAAGTTDPAGSFYANFSAPAVNATTAFGLFSNTSAPGYATGLGEVLFLVDPDTGPSLTPWIRFTQTPVVGQSSVGVMIGGLVTDRNAPASLAAVTVKVSGTGSGEWVGDLDTSGLYANTWDAPAVRGDTDAVFTVSLALPGYTTSPVRFLLPLVPPNATAQGVLAEFSFGPHTVADMGSVSVSAIVTAGATGASVDPGAANMTISSEPYGIVTYWRQVGAGAYSGLYSSPIIAGTYSDLLALNISGGPPDARGSAAGLLEVTAGQGPLNLSLVGTFPAGMVPGTNGTLTVRAAAADSGTYLDRVYMLVSPSTGDPSIAKGTEIFAWTNAYGNVTFHYTAPNASATVYVNVQAVGFVYNFTQANFTLIFQPATIKNQTKPPPPIPNLPTINYSSNESLSVLLAPLALGVAVTAIILLEVHRRRRPPEPGHDPPPPSGRSPLHAPGTGSTGEAAPGGAAPPAKPPESAGPPSAEPGPKGPELTP
jgi:hypothetical protein